MRRTPLVIAACVASAALLASCKDKSKSPEATKAEEAEEAKRETNVVDAGTTMSAPRAYLVHAGSLLEVQGDGSSTTLGPFAGSSWCQVDSQAEVVWGLGEEGLQIFDLTDKSVHTVVQGPGPETVLIRYAGALLGNAEPGHQDATLIVNVSDAPSVKAEIICEGDRMPYCYDDSESEDESKWVLSKMASDSLAVYAKFKLEQDAFLRILAARSKKNEVAKVSPLPAPPQPTLKISQDGCKAIPENCGSLRYLGGERFWAVVTENDAGDYFYEIEQIYDARTEEYVDFEDATRSKVPFEVASGAGLLVSKDNTYALTPSGKLLNLSTAELVREFEHATHCGWR